VKHSHEFKTKQLAMHRDREVRAQAVMLGLLGPKWLGRDEVLARAESAGMPRNKARKALRDLTRIGVVRVAAAHVSRRSDGGGGRDVNFLPDHLRKFEWYAPHQAWVNHTYGLARHECDVPPVRAVLRDADLRDADLRDADLRGAVLSGAVLSGAVLSGAVLPSGDRWEQYLSEVVPALCTAGGLPLEAVATAEHWGCHDWTNCPMAAAFSVADENKIPALYRPRAREFIQLFDSGLIPMPVSVAKNAEAASEVAATPPTDEVGL